MILYSKIDANELRLNHNEGNNINKRMMNGVNLAGWLLTEPSWMYDQFKAPSENDLIQKWRKENGKQYAIDAMKNHWNGYYSESDIVKAAKFGITHFRIPVGYWIVDAPVSVVSTDDDKAVDRSSRSYTMYDFGFNHEGFITGGLNYLEPMLKLLKKLGMKVIVDMHALPGGGSNCQDYAGIQIKDEKNSFWLGKPPKNNSVPIQSACTGSGPYYTSRGDSMTWMDVGEKSVLKLAEWIVRLQKDHTMSNVVESYEVINEPGLLWPVEDRIKLFYTNVIPKVQKMFSDAKLKIHMNINSIYPNEVDMGKWIKEKKDTGIFQSTPGAEIYVDTHKYYNWDGPLTWKDLADRMCGPLADSSWAQYSMYSPPVYIGEWSCQTNLGSVLYTNVSDPTIVSNLKVLYANQISMFTTAANVNGIFYWGLRMGSG